MELQHPTTLLPFRDGRIPGNLGNFQLDKHNVEEWSNMKDPTQKHRGRMEIGKWVDPERKADIHIQRQEDAMKSAKGHENQRTEVIQGTSPDSVFQIVRTEREFQGGGEDKNSSSMSTSYQMSSSRGMRFTSKTTSNKTTTTTTTFPTDRSDDFENLKIPFHPLDTSTQRERINVGRSGTMGVRRPPTRKQPTSSYQGAESHLTKEDPSPTTTTAAGTEPNELSSGGSKNISPKILIGFPVEIQVELRTKLGKGNDGETERVDEATTGLTPISTSFRTLPEVKTEPLNPPDTSSPFNSRRKSYGFESLVETYKDSPVPSFPKSTSTVIPLSMSSPARPLTSTRNMKRFLGDENENISYMETFSPSGISRSWDLMQRLGQQRSELSDKSDSNSRPWHMFLPPDTMDLSSNHLITKSIFAGSPREEGIEDSGLVSLNDYYDLDSEGKTASPKWRESDPGPSSQGSGTKDLEEDEPLSSPKGMTNWETEWEKTKGDLDRLSASINSSQDERTPLPQPPTSRPYPFSSRAYAEDEPSWAEVSRNNGMGILSSGGLSTGRYASGVVDPDQDSASRISQTWISSSDLQKPSRHASDNELSTSISATSDPSKRALRKVEFCKTEVHFTPEPGKFHIVESDENKPSTAHLFRRKKRKASLERGHSEEPLLSRDKQEEREGDVLPENSVAVSGDNRTLQSSAHENGGKPSSDEGQSFSFAEDYSRNFGRNYGGPSAITPVLPKPLLTSHPHELIKTVCGDQEMFPGNELEGMEYEEERLEDLPYNPYEELKIQKYLKQLKPLPTRATFEPREKRDRTFAHNQFIMNQVRADLGAEEEADEDDELHFRYGSFVPLATRQSLIEMNNRNRMKRMNCSTNSQMSDVSSTTSNYSLPHSDNSAGYDPKPSRLMALEGILIGGKQFPGIPSTNHLRYSIFDEKEQRKDGDHLQNYKHGEPHSGIPKPVLPIGLRSIPPYRSGRRSFSSSPVRDPGNRFPKPPTPILPIQFSTFEKTGEGLRSRFLSKNPHCACSQVGKTSSVTDLHIPERRTLQLKTVVNIRNRDEGTDEGNEALPPINTPVKLSPVIRSMTFPSQQVTKPNRSEPEWVSKAKAKARTREIQGTEWMEIGQRQSTESNVETEPPWMSELKTRNRASPVPPDDLGHGQASSASLIYPWQRNGERMVTGKFFENDNVVASEQDFEIPQSPAAFHEYPIGNNVDSENHTTYMSLSAISTTTANNKSIVDLNRDFESITINPNQIELSPALEERSEQRISSRKTTGSSKDTASNSLRRVSSHRTLSKSGNISLAKSSAPPDIRTEKIKASKSGERETSHQWMAPHHRKPLQTSTAVNQNQGISKENGESVTGQRIKAKTVPKPPKPPQRISSLVNSQTATTLNASLEKKKKSSPIPRKVNAGDPIVLEASSTTSSLTIHRHPTLKVSKLPLKMTSTPSSSKPSSPDAHEHVKTKSNNVSLMAEARRLYKGKQSKTGTSGEALKSDGTVIRTRSPVTSASPQQRKR